MSTEITFSWYEICLMRTALRMMRKKTLKDQARARRRHDKERAAFLVHDGPEPEDRWNTKVGLFLQMEKTLKDLERQLKRRHGVDSIDAFHQTHEEKLNAEKLVELTIKKGKSVRADRSVRAFRRGQTGP